MSSSAGPVQAVIDLRPGRYQSGINCFRSLLETVRGESPFFLVAVRTPADDTVEVQIRRDDAYLMGFKGGDGWYHFNGEKRPVLGKPCGVGSNYNDLGHVGKITYADLRALGELGRFRKGVALDKRLCAILIAITSEAARFATVATYFTGLTNSVGTEHSEYLKGGVDFEYLKNTYFTKWEKPPEIELQPGKLYHFHTRKGEILLPRRR